MLFFLKLFWKSFWKHSYVSVIYFMITVTSLEYKLFGHGIDNFLISISSDCFTWHTEADFELQMRSLLSFLNFVNSAIYMVSGLQIFLYIINPLLLYEAIWYFCIYIKPFLRLFLSKIICYILNMFFSIHLLFPLSICMDVSLYSSQTNVSCIQKLFC